MKKSATRLMAMLSFAAVMVFVPGCQSPGQNKAPTPPQPQKPLSEPGIGYGPSYTTYVKDGVKYTKGAMAFPTGNKYSSALLLEKVVPTEVLIGKSLTYSYQVRNLTDYHLQMVTVSDRVTPNFNASDASPRADKVEGSVATWDLGALAPEEVKEIKVMGTATEEGTLVTCGWASYNLILCEPIKVVRAEINLRKTLTPEVVICDPVECRIIVENTGSSQLTGIQVTDMLPDGLLVNGQTNLTLEVGTLPPGEVKELTFTAMATAPGQFVTTARVTSTQGAEAEATAETLVQQPVLELSCKAPQQQTVGRPLNVCIDVANKGDTPSEGTLVSLPIPSGATFNQATAGGQLYGNLIRWNVGALASGVSKELCASFTAENPTNLTFEATARGACAPPVQATCRVAVGSVPAKESGP
jgi:uncharacterized repeat protein (TIGR01451 family)